MTILLITLLINKYYNYFIFLQSISNTGDIALITATTPSILLQNKILYFTK